MAVIKEKLTSNDEGLRLIVRKAEGGEPLLDLIESIGTYEFKLNSADDCVAKDKNIMMEMKITGKFREEIAEQASKFFVEWALEEGSAAYKYLELLKFNEVKTKKRYVLPKAFVVDYSEKEQNDANLSFELFLKENKDDRKAFRVYVDEERMPIEGDGNE